VAIPIVLATRIPILYVMISIVRMMIPIGIGMIPATWAPISARA
jgi:hypothetical protein